MRLNVGDNDAHSWQTLVRAPPAPAESVQRRAARDGAPDRWAAGHARGSGARAGRRVDPEVPGALRMPRDRLLGALQPHPSDRRGAERVEARPGDEGAAGADRESPEPALEAQGSIFRERYHARVIRTMREIRRAIRYVVLNARKHGIRIPKDTPDPCSSGPWFQFWRGRRWNPFRSDPSPVVRPRTLNLETATVGLTLDLNEVPGQIASWAQECSWEALGLTT